MTSRLEQVATLAGPYGKTIPLYSSPELPGEYLHDTDGMMDMAGIHSPADRERCRKALGAGNGKSINVSVLFYHGGRTVPKKDLVKPASPATLQLPAEPKIREVADNWTNLVMDQVNWSDRSAALLNVMEDGLREAKSWTQNAFMGEFVHSFALSILITSAIEHLAETEIDCLEAAAFYAVSVHPEWQAAGVEWLKPFRKSWFRDWALARPVWQEFAADMRKVDCDLPSWIVKGATP